VNIRLRLIDETAAKAIVAGRCPPGYRCAEDYPAEPDRIAARLFLERCEAGFDPRPFGAFLICLADRPEAADSEALTVGGIGFHGGIDPLGRVEIGYGIVPSQQRRGYATKALGLLVELAAELGATVLTAETYSANAASRAVLLHHNFTPVGVGGDPQSFERPLGCR
jgi:RimJ/RimL family protein N-acetyltransferase